MRAPSGVLRYRSLRKGDRPIETGDMESWASGGSTGPACDDTLLECSAHPSRNSNQDDEGEDLDATCARSYKDEDESSDEEDDESELDSDCEERWGPYFWSENGDARDESKITLNRKAWDYFKYASFKTCRKLNFAGEVVTHFFGLHNSPYQWIIESVEREKQMEEEQIRIADQREALERKREHQALSQQMDALEGGL